MNAILGVPMAFAVILILVRKRMSYGLSIIAGASIIGLFYGFGKEEFFRTALDTLKDRETVNLTSILILIGILGHGFKKTGHIEIIIEELRKIFGERTLLASIPSVFGMLPIPGGALMSAPVIEPEANSVGLSPEQKTYLNIWFRHILVLIFPINSSLILVASLSETSVYTLVALLFPLFFISIAVGYFAVLKDIKNTPRKDRSGSLARALFCLSPIILVIVLNVGLRVGFAAGLLFGILLLFLESRVSFRDAARIVREGFSLQMALAMVGIMFFRQTINTSGVVEDFMNLLEGSPLFFLMIFLPMVISLFCGLSMLSIGVTFPLLFPLSPLSPPLFAIIIYVSAHTGYLASPLHLCLIVTKEYFKASLVGVYRRLLPSVAILVLYNTLFTLLSYKIKL